MDSVGRLALHAATTALIGAQQQVDDDAARFQEHIHAAHETFIGIVPWIRKILYTLFVGSLLVASSIGTYGLFYLAVMPSHHATEQLYFDYTCHHQPTCEAKPGEGVYLSEASNCKLSVCTPVAKVDLFAKHTPWEAFRPEVLPQPVRQDRLLKAKQEYYLEVALSLPESETNVNVGMFGVSVKLQTSDGSPLASSIRSARMPHESAWIGVVRKAACILALLIGALTESRTVVVPSFRHFVESLDHPLQHIEVRLLAQGVSWPHNTPVEAVSGEIRIGKELNAFQGILKEWFYTCYLFGALFAFIVQALLWLIGQIWWDARQRQKLQDYSEPNMPPEFHPAHADWDAQGATDHGFEENDRWEDFYPSQGDDWDDLPPVDQNHPNNDRPVTPDGTDRSMDDDRRHVPDEVHDDESTVPSSAAFVAANETERNARQGGQGRSKRPAKKQEELLAERVMRGHIGPYIIFTGEG